MWTWKCKKGNSSGKLGTLLCSSQRGWKWVTVVTQTEVGCSVLRSTAIVSQVHTLPHSPRTLSRIRGQGLRGRLIWAIAGMQEVASQSQEFLCSQCGSQKGDVRYIHMSTAFIECWGHVVDGDRNRVMSQKGPLMALLEDPSTHMHWNNLCLFLPPHAQPTY